MHNSFTSKFSGPTGNVPGWEELLTSKACFAKDKAYKNFNNNYNDDNKI